MKRRTSTCAMAALLLTGALAAVAGCGGTGKSDAVVGSGSTSPAKVSAKLRAADPRLGEIAAEAGKLLPGGRKAYDRRIAKLKGLPIVVNKWGSWCGPCRAEFPMFQDAARDLGDKVAFLGVNVSDTGESAGEFLRERPVPYPSYVDDKFEIAKLLPPLQGAPTTGFYNAAGELTHVKAGEYRTAKQLRDDIRIFATAADSRIAR